MAGDLNFMCNTTNIAIRIFLFTCFIKPFGILQFGVKGLQTKCLIYKKQENIKDISKMLPKCFYDNLPSHNQCNVNFWIFFVCYSIELKLSIYVACLSIDKSFLLIKRF